MFKNIFKRLTAIILRPGETWEELSSQEERRDTFLSQFIYPVIGMIALAAFLGILFTRKEFDFEIALKITLRTVIAVTGGFYLGAYLLSEVWKGIFNQPKAMELCRCFVGYASSLLFVLYIITSLLPEFFFLHIFVLYTVYIIWEGAVLYMQVAEEERLKFTIIASFIVILTPFIIEHALRMLMPGFRI
jgi:cation transport ATPase